MMNNYVSISMLHFKEEKNVKVFLNAYVSYSCGMSYDIRFILFFLNPCMELNGRETPVHRK